MFDSQALGHAIYVAVDTTEGSRSLRQFNRTFRETLKGMGKSTEEIDSLSQIAKEFADGKRSLDEFDDEFKELIENYRTFREVASPDVSSVNGIFGKKDKESCSNITQSVAIATV